MRIVNNKEMYNIEEKTFNEYGVDEKIIIENVGIRVADLLFDELLQEKSYGEIVVFAGKGNNGADALCSARHLVNQGQSVRVFMLAHPDELSQQCKSQAQLAEAYGVKLTLLTRVEELESYFTQTQDEFFIIDGIFGTGYRGPLSNFLFDIVSCINKWSDVIVSLDMPSGVEADSGTIHPDAIQADYTLSIGLPKIGYYIGHGPQQVGDIWLLEAGFPSELFEGGDKFLLTKEIIQTLAPSRDKFAHKNTYGHTLVIAGSPGLTGAAVLASRAALNVGSGLVTCVTWKEAYSELVARMPAEIMCGLIPTDERERLEVIRGFDTYKTIIIGPGLGISERSRDVVLKVLNHFSGPVVVDADAIKILDWEKDKDLLLKRRSPTILTPHMGEFSSLMEEDKEKVTQSPLTHLRKAVDQLKSTIILKSSSTFLGFTNNEVYINHFPNDGMATGGSGDVLAGIVGGMLSQLREPAKSSGIFKDDTKFFHTLCVSVSLHSVAGLFAARDYGVRSMNAGSIIECLGPALKEFDNPGSEDEDDHFDDRRFF